MTSNLFSVQALESRTMFSGSPIGSAASLQLADPSRPPIQMDIAPANEIDLRQSGDTLVKAVVHNNGANPLG